MVDVGIMWLLLLAMSTLSWQDEYYRWVQPALSLPPPPIRLYISSASPLLPLPVYLPLPPHPPLS